jgi:predicted RND superfamily exporter protein
VAVTLAVAVFTFVLMALAVLPSLFPGTLGFLSPVKVDTDPENMLPATEEVRVFHNRMMTEMDINEMVVLGVVNEEHPHGVFNPESLRKIYELTNYAKGLSWQSDEEPEKSVGVIAPDVIAPSTVDSVEGRDNRVEFRQLMETPPATQEEALEIKRRAERIPFLNGTMISENGKALAIYLPITHKNMSYRIATELEKKIAEFSGDEQYFITGQPVAQDTFGVEMFRQMAISAPIAMLVIFLLMLYFFRKLVLIISPMIVAMVSVIVTMSLLIITGNTIHIMSSMIPIFIMPIAVLNSVHILSEFFDRYQKTKDREKTILGVMETLFLPMLYTSLTTMAGFGSLALTPIPPVQIFGIFIAIGVFFAWLMTIVFIPAYIMLLRQKSLENFGESTVEDSARARTLLSRLLNRVGDFTYRRAKWVAVGTIVFAVLAVLGIGRININDNPTRWFQASHPIRVSDRVLNKHFGGTYMAYLTLTPADETAGDYVQMLDRRTAAVSERISGDVERYTNEVFDATMAEGSRIARNAASKDELIELLFEYVDETGQGDPMRKFAWDEAFYFLEDEDMRDTEGELDHYVEGLNSRARARAAELGSKLKEDTSTVFSLISDEARRSLQYVHTKGDLLGKLREFADEQKEANEEMEFAWDRASLFLLEESQVFKQPEVLRYISELQEELLGTGVVGKSNSVADIVKTVHRELVSGDDKDYRIPESFAVVGQSLDQFLASNRPRDLWHFVTPNYLRASLWVQLKSGNNNDMQKVVKAVEDFVQKKSDSGTPQPYDMSHKWYGLTYINVIWQQKMVSGMLQAFLGSFMIVLLMMIVLFRSGLWGILSMIPLTLTIGLIYGSIGFVGKDYDMPVAVLSSLSLGLAVDYAIHFLVRSRDLQCRYHAWKTTYPHVFDEPARAITRNVIVIGVGFLPLLFAPLVPYQTVGVFLAAILLLAGGITLVLLPALMRLLERYLFPETSKQTLTCHCATCSITAVTIVALLVVNLKQFTQLGWTALSVISVVGVLLLMLLCWLVSRTDRCMVTKSRKETR